MSTTPTPFGRLVTAMVTPFAADGSVDLALAGRLRAQTLNLRVWRDRRVWRVGRAVSADAAGLHVHAARALEAKRATVPHDGRDCRVRAVQQFHKCVAGAARGPRRR